MRSFTSLAGGRASSVVAAAAFVVAGAATANAASYDFNTSQADYNATFTNGATPGAGYVWQSTGGVGGSGRVNGSSSAPESYFTTPAGQFTAAGNTASASIYILAGTDNVNSANDYVNLDRSNATSGQGPTGGLSAGISTLAGTGSDPSTLNHTLRLTSRNNAPATSSTTNDTDTFLLATGRWYQIRLTATYQGSNNFNALVQLYDWGTDGLTGGNLVDSYAATRTLSSFVNTDVYGGFRARTVGGGGVRAAGADNFDLQPVPEPAAAGVLGLAGAGLLARRRRRGS